MRKNDLFAYSKEGAISSCILMLLVMRTKEKCLDVEKYFSYVLSRLNTSTTTKLRELLPYSDQLPIFFINQETELTLTIYFKDMRYS